MRRQQTVHALPQVRFAPAGPRQEGSTLFLRPELQRLVEDLLRTIAHTRVASTGFAPAQLVWLVAIHVFQPSVAFFRAEMVH